MKTLIMPIVALRGMNVLPSMLIHFDIKRKSTVKAINEAMNDSQKIFLVAQKNPEIENPVLDDIYTVGTVACIRQVIKLPGNVLRVLVEGMEKGYIETVNAFEPYMKGMITIVEDNSLKELSETEQTALMNSLRDVIELYSIENDKVGKEVFKKILRAKTMDVLLTEASVKLPLTMEERQNILEADNKLEAFKLLTIELSQKLEIMRIKREFQNKVKEHVDKNQKEYILREQMKVIREELGEENTVTDAERYMQELSELDASEVIYDKIKREIKKFKNISSNSSESAVVRGYIETLLAMPWNKASKDNNNIKNATKILDADHYGLEKVKERVLEFLAVRQLTSKGETPIICLVGPPGTGKTSIAKSVAKALDKEYIRICLGGVRDESEIRGHRRTYIGAMPGKIAKGLKNAGVKNPLMLLDEIDKVSSDYKGDVSSALLEVLDPEQNEKFSDHYIEIPIDLSEVLFIATANDANSIPRPLLDRMEIIEVNSYTQNEKYHIARNYLVKKQLKKNGLKKTQLTFSAKAINCIISGYTKEAGVRNLERKIGAVCRKAAKEIVETGCEQIKITDKNLEKYLGNKKYTIELKNSKDDVGIVRGLAWTSVGGVTLSIEVNVMPGKGGLELTGQMGEVMRESAVIGVSYIRSIASQYNIADDFFEKNDVHIHIPEGAVPKDGPSAGISMATAMLSAFSGIKVKANLAMTGEITLRGRVLPIGGLKEKLLAAKQAGITNVLVPEKNKGDVSEISSEILDGLDIVFVDNMKQVLKEALVK